MKIEYTVQIWREGAQFVAHAMPIDVVSSGGTPDQARAALDEAVGLFLSTAQDMARSTMYWKSAPMNITMVAGALRSGLRWSGTLLN
jgi:hypothetical protein